MSSPRLQIDRSFRDGATILVPRGVLDLGTYSQLRDALVTYALEQPRAVVVDLGWLRVPAAATLAVFSSAWMHVADWPAVPIVLVAVNDLDRRRLQRSGITNSMPLHRGVDEAIGSAGRPPARQRSLLELPHNPESVAAGRRFVDVTLRRWECADRFPDARLIASELVENAVRHTDSDPRLRLELGRGGLAVAVYDDDPAQLKPPEPDITTPGGLGLVLVAKLTGGWSPAPTLAGGKVVWAVLKPA